MRFIPKTLSSRSTKNRSLNKQRSSDKLPVVKLEIVSDNVCPFCYLLYHRLHAAMKQFEGKLDFEIHWISYQLQPLAPPEGVPKTVFMVQKFKDQAHCLLAKKQAFFKSEGLEYTGDGVIGNTFNSHRLAKSAAKESLEKQDEVVGLIMKAFFAEGKNINEAQVLRDIAKQANLADADRVVEDPTYCADEVRHDLETMYKDVIGVPHTIANSHIRLGGAQDTAVYTKLFKQLLEESRSHVKEETTSS